MFSYNQITGQVDSPVHGNRCASLIIIPGGGQICSAQICGINSPGCLYRHEMCYLSQVKMYAQRTPKLRNLAH